MKERISKLEYYLNIAKEVSTRSTCLRKHYGAIIVKNDEIISTGYNGAPKNRKNCCDCNYCLREKLKIPSGERYELCRSVHAEANAIISASRQELLHSNLFLYGFEKSNDDFTPINLPEPCSMCKRLIINAGIKNVIVPNIEKDIHGNINIVPVFTPVSDYIKNDDTYMITM